LRIRRRIKFQDGSVDTTLKIKPGSKSVPKTGDSAPLALWLGLILIGTIALGTLTGLKRGARKK